MTLIIGIKCTDGIVMGADSAMSMMGYMQQPTRKLAIVGQLIIGSAGGGDIAHQFQWALEPVMATGNFQNLHVTEATNVLRMAMLNVLKTNYEACDSLRKLSGSPKNISDPTLTESLIAFPVGTDIRLFNFNPTCSPIEITEHVCFGSIGSGYFPANPFLSFLQRMWWENRQPDLADGMIATIWALNHAISTSSGGVADPKQVITLSMEQGRWVAKELTEADLMDHIETIRQLETALGAALRYFLNALRQPQQPPPQPPPVCAPQPPTP